MDVQKLDELLRLTKENNAMLRSIRRGQFFARFFKIVWIVVVFVVLPYIAWLYIEPYVGTILQQYQAVQGEALNAQRLMEQYQQLLQSLPKP